MAGQDEGRMAGGLAPHLTIREGKAAEAIDFYKAAFAAEELARMPDEQGKLMHAHLRINGGHVLLNDDYPDYTGGVPVPAGVTIHLQVDDADAWWQRAVAAGAMVRMPIGDQFWGDRYGQLVDPYGHHWSIGSPLNG